VAGGGGGLDVLRVVVLAPKDDQLFQSTGHIELTLVEEALVAGAQQRSVHAFGVEAKGAGGLLGFVQVAGGHRLAGNSDLAKPSFGQGLASDGVDDVDGHAGSGRAAAHPRTSPGGAGLYGAHRAFAFEGARVDIQAPGSCGPGAASDQ
jgi:hypothetical protein